MPKIIYEDIPAGVNEGSTYSSIDAQPFCDITLINSEMPESSYASLEPNYWRLNGKFKLLEDNKKINSFWSDEMSDQKGNFTVNPKITIDFDDLFSATALTFVFDEGAGEHLQEMKIKWYRELAVISERTYQVNNVHYTAINKVEGFNKIVIEISKGHPRRFAKIHQIIVGQVSTFDEKELEKVNIVNDVNPISAELAISTLNFTLRDTQERDFIFQRQQPFKVYQGDKLQGQFYIDKATKTAQNIYELSAVNAIGVLEQDNYIGGLFTNKKVVDLIREVLNGKFEFEVDSSYSNKTVTGYLPIASKRDTLRQIAFAIGATIITYGTDKIIFKPVTRLSTGAITQEQIFYGGSVELRPILSQINLYSHTYTITAEEKQVFKGNVSGTNTVTFQQPHGYYKISGGRITSSGANFVTFTATGSEVIINAKEYQDNTSLYIKRNPEAPIADNENAYEIKDATLISDKNAEEILETIYNYYLNRETLKQEIVITDQEPGQLITSIKPFDGNIKGYIQKMSINYTARHMIADVEIFGTQIGIPPVWIYAGTGRSGDNAIYYRPNNG